MSDFNTPDQFDAVRAIDTHTDTEVTVRRFVADADTRYTILPDKPATNHRGIAYPPKPRNVALPRRDTTSQAPAPATPDSSPEHETTGTTEPDGAADQAADTTNA